MLIDTVDENLLQSLFQREKRTKCFKWSHIVSYHGPKLSQVVLNSPRVSQMVPDDPKWSQTVLNYLKLSQMAPNDHHDTLCVLVLPVWYFLIKTSPAIIDGWLYWHTYVCRYSFIGIHMYANIVLLAYICVPI